MLSEEYIKRQQWKKDNLKSWSIDRRGTEAIRDSIISEVRRCPTYSLCKPENILPPIFFRPIEDMSDDEIRLLDNMMDCYRTGFQVHNGI